MDERSALTRDLIRALSGGRHAMRREVGEALDLGERLGTIAAIETALSGARLVRLIGSGGMGRVYLAEGARGRARRFAVKLMRPELAVSSDARRRFLHEAESARRVVHPGVVRLIDARIVELPAGPMPLLSMEMVFGRTLRADIDALGPLPESECRRIAVDASRALAAIHAAGIVHRDVKPANLMRTRRGVVKIVDLGVSRLVDAATRLTRTGQFVGTLDYAAPEQFDPSWGALDGRADLHALGVTIFEALTGRLPWTLDESDSVAVPTTRARVSDFRPDVDPVLDETVARLLRPRVDERPESAETVARALESAGPPARPRRGHASATTCPADGTDAHVLFVTARARQAAEFLDDAARASAVRRRLVLRGSYDRGRDGAFDAVGPALTDDAARAARDWPVEARTFAVIDALQGDSAGRRTDLLLDRLDRASPESLAAFASFLSELDPRRVRIVATWRTADERTIPEWLVTAAHVLRITSSRPR